MRKKRLWVAAPMLALGLLVLPTIQAEAFRSTASNYEAIVTEVIKMDRELLNAGEKVKNFNEAATLMASDLKNIQASTTFTIDYKSNDVEAFKQDIAKAFATASGMNEYVYGMGTGYAMEISYAGTTYTTTLYYNYHLLSKSFEKKDLGGGRYQTVFRKEFHADDVKTVQKKEEEITAYVKKAATEIFTKNMSDFEKVKAAYDFVILQTTYGATDKVGYGAGHSPYSIVKDGVGVCQAYALLFQRLMDEAGVTSKYVTGERLVPGYVNKKEGHAWNVVTIDGQTYHIDTTHGDPVGAHLAKDYISYQTFLLTEEQIKARGHIITETRPYTKPVINLYGAWHEVEQPMKLGDFMYYTVLEGTYVENGYTYGRYGFKQATVNEKTGAMTSKKLYVTSDRAVNAVNLTKFNNKLFFSNYGDYARLWVINEDGTLGLKKDLYNGGTEGLPQIGEIKIVGDELLIYDLSNPNVIVYREKKEVEQEQPLMPVEPDPPKEPEKPKEPEAPKEPVKPTEPEKTPEQLAQEALKAEVEDKFKKDSPIVKQIETAKSAADFEKLMKELSSYVNSEIVNPQLQAFQVKVQGYKAVQNELKTTKPWAGAAPKVEDPKKPWTITFSMAIQEADKGKLYVTNIFNQKLVVNVVVKGEVVTVTPTASYDKGATYYLIIPKGVKSATGTELTEAISLPFTFE